MKKIILSSIIMSLTVLSCEKKTTDLVTSDDSLDSMVVIPETNEPIESSTLQTCYMEVISKDSVFLTLDDNLGTITGKMRYKNFEKDSSVGDVMGYKNGDTLKLVYIFEAEGTTSEREIYFLKKADNLLEATGQYKVDGIKSTYANTSQLKYDGHTLNQVDCTDFSKRFNKK